MATKKKAAKTERKKATPATKGAFAFTRANHLTLFIGLVVIVIGYITLRMGSITLAPLLLVLGYCVIIPIGILLRPKKEPKAQRGNPSKHTPKPQN
jgi:hypothetical protein